MDINEIKMGNYLQYEDNDNSSVTSPILKIEKVVKIEKDNNGNIFLTFKSGKVKPIYCVKWIPLGEEHLLECMPQISPLMSGSFLEAGERPPSETKYQFNDVILTRRSFNTWEFEYNRDNLRNSGVILSVHELQNLYNRLTGNELNIEL